MNAMTGLVCGSGCGGTMLAFGVVLDAGPRRTNYRCTKCGEQAVVEGNPPGLIDELSANAILARAALDPRAFVEGAIAGRDVLVSVCATCSKEGVWNPLGVKSAQGMPSGLSHTICPAHLAAFGGDRE